ncbi:MAG: ATP-binding protein [Gemmatimonadota bacterium]|jgi:serine/threonine-protein kinase RsbW|nr:ATP-binding protein [Gemmatimonadota bacterium]
MDLPSDLSLVEAVVSYLAGRCRDFGFDGVRLDLNFRVSVTEALVNAVLYGNRSDREKTVRVEMRLAPGHLRVTVIDQGPGFDPARVPDPTLPENLGAPGGRGLFLIRHLMDRTEFLDRGNIVRMTLVHSGPESGSA